jgi:hypothetical protein
MYLINDELSTFVLLIEGISSENNPTSNHPVMAIFIRFHIWHERRAS